MGIDAMLRHAAALIALLVMVACGDIPRDIVVKEGDAELLVKTQLAVFYLESQAKCDIWNEIQVGGTKRDWSRKYPRQGVVAIEVDEHCRSEGYAGYTDFPKTRGDRARICVVGNASVSVVAHELIHALIYTGHFGECTFRSDANYCEDGLDTETLQKLRGRCIEPWQEDGQ